MNTPVAKETKKIDGSIELLHYKALGRTLKRRNLPEDEASAIRFARVVVSERLLDDGG